MFYSSFDRSQSHPTMAQNVEVKHERNSPDIPPNVTADDREADQSGEVDQREVDPR